MSLNFVKPDWIATRKKWANLPPWVKCAIKNEFHVPTLMWEAILPAPGISIQEILDYSLPRTCATVKSDPVTFFSCRAPDQISESQVAQLQWLPIPTALVVAKLVKYHSQAWLDGYQSIRYMHLCNAVATYFPLQLISLWETFIDLQANIHQPWLRAQDWLCAKTKAYKSTERQELAEECKAFLGAVPWDSHTVQDVWMYLSFLWTTGTQQNDLLDILGDHIISQADLAKKYSVHSLTLTAKIIEAVVMHDPDIYQSSQTFQWIWQLGDEIATCNSACLTLHHLGKKNLHWVSLVIDREAGILCYSDSYGNEMPADLMQACHWWLSQHTLDRFTVVDLPIAPQAASNTSSCRILANNSLENHSFPDMVPLIPSSRIEAARMRKFLLMGEVVLEQVHW